MRELKGSCAVLAALAGAAALFFLAVPSHAQLFGGDDVARRQIAEQSKRLDELKLQNEDLSTRLARIEESLKGLSAANPALDLAQQLERLRQEMTQLRGQIEVLGNDVQMAAKRQRDMYVDLDTRMKLLEQPAAATPPAPQPAPASAAAPATVAAATAARPRARPRKRKGELTKRRRASARSATTRARSRDSGTSSPNIRRARSPIGPSTGSATPTTICANSRTRSRASRG